MCPVCYVAAGFNHMWLAQHTSGVLEQADVSIQRGSCVSTSICGSVLGSVHLPVTHLCLRRIHTQPQVKCWDGPKKHSCPVLVEWAISFPLCYGTVCDRTCGGGKWLTSSDSPAMRDLRTIYWLVQGVLKTLNREEIKQIFSCDFESGVRVKWMVRLCADRS